MTLTKKAFKDLTFKQRVDLALTFLKHHSGGLWDSRTNVTREMVKENPKHFNVFIKIGYPANDNQTVLINSLLIGVLQTIYDQMSLDEVIDEVLLLSVISEIVNGCECEDCKKDPIKLNFEWV